MTTEKDPNTTEKDQNRFLAWGYKTAIALALFSLLATSAHLFYYLLSSDTTIISADTMAAFNAERRMALLSTGVFTGMSFGFLGFALFLIQAKGEVEGSFEGGGTKVNIARMSPGLFVIACATAIICVSISFKIEYKQSDTGADYCGMPAPQSAINAAPTPPNNESHE